MRSPNKWIIEIVLVSLALLVLGLAVSHGFAAISSGSLSRLEQVLITIYLLLVGLVVELLRWARESVEDAGNTVRDVLKNELPDSAALAVRGAILRTIFPSGNVDLTTARIHFDIVEDYLRQVESKPSLVQRASGVLAERHLACWREDLDELTGSRGLPLRMDEAARMSAAMLDGATKYLVIERTPADPAKSWSPGFLKVIDDFAKTPALSKRFVLLANAGSLWDEDPSEERERERHLFLQEEAYLRQRGFEIFFCDERAVCKELGTDEIPQENFEVFSGKAVLQMDPADSYDRVLPVRLRAFKDLGDVRRFLEIVEELSQPANSRSIKSGQLE